MNAKISDLLRYDPGSRRLPDHDASATPGAIGDKGEILSRMPALLAKLEEHQERLYAGWVSGGERRSVLLVLQGMDTSGKGGTVKHVATGLNPYGYQVTSFKSPTKEELSHDFLWRIRNALPRPGHIGIFDRSHYEDVLIGRVHNLVPRATWSRRYATINRFEEKLTAAGCTIIKCFLHISPETQRKRLLARLENPDKHWKYNPGDVDERELWHDYQEAYTAALDKCATEAAPWFVVPSDRKWYRNYAVTMLLAEAFDAMDLAWPKADFDVRTELERVRAS